MHQSWGRRGRNRMVVGFITTYAVRTYHHERCEFEPHSCEMYPNITLCKTVCQ